MFVGADPQFAARKWISHLRAGITGEPDGFLNWVTWSDIPVAAMDTRIEEISADIQRRVPGRGVSCEWSVLGTQPNRRQLIDEG